MLRGFEVLKRERGELKVVQCVHRYGFLSGLLPPFSICRHGEHEHLPFLHPTNCSSRFLAVTCGVRVAEDPVEFSTCVQHRRTACKRKGLGLLQKTHVQPRIDVSMKRASARSFQATVTRGRDIFICCQGALTLWPLKRKFKTVTSPSSSQARINVLPQRHLIRLIYL